MMERMQEILIVDDELENLRTLEAAFKHSQNYRLLRANTAELALKIIRKHNPCLVITDWDMPDMSGIDLIKSIKSNPETESIPIIMCTGVMTSAENLSIALDAGAIDYVRMPIDPIEIQARVRTALNLTESLEKIKKLNQTKDKLFSIVSHDIRSPINSILGLSGILRNNLDDLGKEEIKEVVEKIYSTSDSALKMLKRLLSWSISQSGMLESHPEILNIASVVSENIELLSNEINTKKINVISEVPEEHTCHADSRMVNMIVHNLLSNAIKFTNREGSVEITSKISDKDVDVSIKDNGVGISPEILDDMLGKGLVKSTSGTDNEAGTGLGIMMCKEFIARNGGKLSAESELGKGSIFRFTLPREPKK